MRSFIVAALVSLVWGSLMADGEPCFVGTPTEFTSVNRTARDAVELQWTSVDAAMWYEVMRCDAAPGPCTLVSLMTEASSVYVDAQADASTLYWYRIIAITESAGELCANDEYCSLPFGQCAGAGTCSLHCELCVPVRDFVCGCSSSGGSAILNPCSACCSGRNIRHAGFCSESTSFGGDLDWLFGDSSEAGSCGS